MGWSHRAAGVALGLALAGVAVGQQTLNYPVGVDVAYRVDSGTRANHGDAEAVVFTELVHVPNAGWLRLYFAGAELPYGSYLRLTAARDGEVQKLDGGALRMWQNTSAYFNGDIVLLELVAGPATQTNRVVLHHVATQYVPEGAAPAAECGICGEDDRVPSNAPWACRLMPVGCSATVYNTGSCLVSAGHCRGGANVAQFNVPPSYGCVPNQPPVDDQFIITNWRDVNGGVGNDWMVMTTGVNGLGQTPYQRYRALRPIAEQLPEQGDITINGYGIDDECERTQVQQYSEGWITSQQWNHYIIYIDLTFGNSGSSVVWKNRIIGVVTHCSYGCPNFATRIDLPSFAQARDELCPTPARRPGDANCDGAVNFADINPFVLALADPIRWQGQFPDCNLLNNDLNCDGEMNFADITGFVTCLGGNCDCP